MSPAEPAQHRQHAPRRGRAPTWVARALLPLPAFAILAVALPRLISGAALEAAYPATTSMAADVALPEPIYRATAEILSRAAAGDGEAQSFRAQAAAAGNEPADRIVPALETALRRAPASARGWIALAGLLGEGDPKKAAAALSLGIDLAPRDYFLIPPQLIAGAPLWDYLPREARDTLVADARLLVADERFHDQLVALLNVPGGAALVTRSLADDPDRIRALNRSVARERQQAQ
jgi:hypothetical protein